MRSVLLVLAFVSLASTVRAQRVADTELPLYERVIEHRLQNGWLFLLLPRSEAPVISFETYVPAGAAHDPAGLSGLAQHVKNMLFKGSARLGSRDWEAESAALAQLDLAHAAWVEASAGTDSTQTNLCRSRLQAARRAASELVISEEFSRVLEDAGCGDSLNAFTDEDSTRFVVSLPSNQLEKWCWLESERFRAPVFREFYIERDALLEDRLSRVERDAVGRVAENLRACAYPDHPLGRPALGTEASLQGLDRANAMAFFKERYGARHLTTAIVGDFDPDLLRPMLDAYFESVPAGPEVLPSPPPTLEQQGERRVIVTFDAKPMLWIAWHVPPKSHPDSTAVDIAVRLLGYARSSRIEKRLIRETGLASELVANPAWQGDRYASLAILRCVPNIGIATENVEAAIYEEIQRLALEGPSAEELAGVKRVASADHFRSLRANEAIAAGLNDSQVERGHWRSFFSTDQRLWSVSSEDVQRVLRTYFIPARRTVATLVPAEVSK